MPSVRSIDLQEYYGNPRNHFWTIMYRLFGGTPPTSYKEKIAFLKEKQIALWDTIGSCFREGSLDSAIKDEEPNNIPQLVTDYPTLQLIACNGTKSYTTLKKYFSDDELQNITIIKLPSSSPIPGRYNKTLDEKVEEWKKILEYL